jgi:hypothetical protein
VPSSGCREGLGGEEAAYAEGEQRDRPSRCRASAGSSKTSSSGSCRGSPPARRWSAAFSTGCGRLAAITSRTGFFLKTFARWREDILLKETRIDIVADLGYGVLDTAMVETAAYVLEKTTVPQAAA